MFHSVASRYLQRVVSSKASVRLDPKMRKQINKALGMRGLDERKSFETAERGYSEVWDVLSDFNIVVDDIISSHIFRDGSTEDGKADDGQQNLWLAFKTNDPFTNEQITNSKLVFTFHRKDNGTFGCLVYVS